LTAKVGLSAIGAFSTALMPQGARCRRQRASKDDPVGADLRPLKRPFASLRAGSSRLLLRKSASGRGGGWELRNPQRRNSATPSLSLDSGRLARDSKDRRRPRNGLSGPWRARPPGGRHFPSRFERFQGVAAPFPVVGNSQLGSSQSGARLPSAFQFNNYVMFFPSRFFLVIQTERRAGAVCRAGPGFARPFRPTSFGRGLRNGRIRKSLIPPRLTSAREPRVGARLKARGLAGK
jgi:hypothetical protein